MSLTQSAKNLAANPEAQYQSLLRSLRRRKGFGILFIQCSPATATRLITKVKQNLPQKKIAVLQLDRAIDNLYEIIASRSDRDEISILFIQGIEKSLEPYIQPGYGGQGDYYKLDTVPRILSHLNQQRENFRDHFSNICFVFIVPLFALKYFIQRAPDFFDWRAGVFEFPEILGQESSRSFEEDEQMLVTEPVRTEVHANVSVESRTVRLEGHLLDSGLINRALDLVVESGGSFKVLNFQLGEQRQSTSTAEVKVSAPDHEVMEGILAQLIALGAVDLPQDERDAKLEPVTQAGVYPDDFYALRDLGRYEEALASFDQALKIKPDEYKAWNNRGIALANLGRYEEALASFDQALKIKPDYNSAWYNRGIALGNLGRHEEALVSYDQALKIKPDDDNAWYNRGIALRNLGCYEEALASYDQALKIKPDDDNAWYNRGIALANLGRYEEALASYDQALKLTSDYDSAYYNKACCYALQGKIEQAVENLKQAIELNPSENLKLAKNDSDFDGIREDERFQALLATDD